MPGELPPEMVGPAPSGTPTGIRSKAADVYCWHPDKHGAWAAVRWEHLPHGYVADDRLEQQHPGHNVPARDPGVIAGICGHVTASDHPNVNPGRIEQAYAEVIRDMRRRRR